MLNSGMSWLPGSTRMGTAKWRSVKALAAWNWLQRARWVLSPEQPPGWGAGARAAAAPPPRPTARSQKCCIGDLQHHAHGASTVATAVALGCPGATRSSKVWGDLEDQWGAEPGYLAVHGDLQTPPAVWPYSQAVARKSSRRGQRHRCRSSAPRSSSPTLASGPTGRTATAANRPCWTARTSGRPRCCSCRDCSRRPTWMCCLIRLASVTRRSAQRASTQQRHHPRPHCDQAVTAERFLIGFALLEQLGVGLGCVDEEHTVIEELHLHRP